MIRKMKEEDLQQCGVIYAKAFPIEYWGIDWNPDNAKEYLLDYYEQKKFVGYSCKKEGVRFKTCIPGTRTFKPDTKGAELVPEMKVVSDNIFVKTKANALTSEEFTEFIEKNGINEFFIAGADATGCVKSTCFNMTRAGYSVYVISDCVTSYDLKKMDEMYAYYAKKGCEVKVLKDYMEGR
ncbi:MAG: isochorismatase family protein [Bacillota bacterium]|nr:isochorismatase family protein [Bacillota bacterium]